MRRAIVAGNWKMHGSKAMVAELLDGLLSELQASNPVETVVFPPFVYIDQVAATLANTPIRWGAQDVCAQAQGAFTGEISAEMLNDFGCRYVLIGHSERRTLFNESNAEVAAKFAAAKNAGLTPILCVGETLEQREEGETVSVIAEQLDEVLGLAEGASAFSDAVVAYEPVWAIGTGLTASPEQAQEVHAAIRAQIATKDAQIAENLSILYGGSVKPDNAEQLFAMPDIDGGLIGGASLQAQAFIEIVKCIK